MSDTSEQAADEMSGQTTDESEREEPKREGCFLHTLRYFGVCIWMVWGAFVLASLVFLATPLGAVVFCPLILVLFDSAVGIWLGVGRFKWAVLPLAFLAASWGLIFGGMYLLPDAFEFPLACVVSGVCIVCMLLARWHGYRQELQLPIVDFSEVISPRQVLVAALSGLCIALNMILYDLTGSYVATIPGWIAMAAVLLVVRRHVKRVRPCRFASLPAKPAAATALIGLLIGLGVGLIVGYDDPLQDFPHLQFEAVTVPDEENAFLVLQEMVERFPIDKEKLKEFWDEDEKKIVVETPEEIAKARAVVLEHGACLRKLAEMLSRPRFVPPPDPMGGTFDDERAEWQTYCLRLTELLTVKSQAHLAEGDAEAAMATARMTVSLGELLWVGSDRIMSSMTAGAVLSSGLEQVVRVAESDLATFELLHPLIGTLPGAEKLRASLPRALGGELNELRAWCESFRLLNLAEDCPVAASARKLVKAIFPLVKTNMTLNVLGTSLEEAHRQVEAGEPLVYEERLDWDHLISSAVQEFGLLGFVRNPVGVIFADERLVRLDRILPHVISSTAEPALMQVFLALRCYYLEYGRLPGSLDELAPGYFDKVPPDPFMDEAFRYEPEADPPRIYSGGPDQELAAPDEHCTDDIVVELTFAVKGQD